MSYRYVNDVGYLKIFPMSNWEDDSFCHYCGRKASILLGLEWDHVPALNVKIPDWVGDVRKALIRACSECNSLASDTPHLDYLSRHYWLKGAYLRRYKRLLVGDSFSESEKRSLSGYLLAAVNNHEIKYQEIISAIGFGIRSIDDIESPILKLKTKKGRTIASIITEHISYPESAEEIDYDEKAILYDNQANELDVNPWTAHELRKFIISENRYGARIRCESSYQNWLSSNPSRAMALQLPSSTTDVAGFDFTAQSRTFVSKKTPNSSLSSNLMQVNTKNAIGIHEQQIKSTDSCDEKATSSISSELTEFNTQLLATFSGKEKQTNQKRITFPKHTLELFRMRRSFQKCTDANMSAEILSSALQYSNQALPHLEDKILNQFFTSYHVKTTLPIELFLYYLLIRYEGRLPKVYKLCSEQIFADLSHSEQLGHYVSPTKSYHRTWPFFIALMDAII